MNWFALLERLTPLANLALRYPIENHFRRPEKLSGVDELRELAASRAASPNPVATLEKPPMATSEPIEPHGPIMERPGLQPQTMQWQLKETRAELWLLEGHLKNKCLDCGDPPTCCWKHGTNLIAIAPETQSMTTDPIWDEIRSLSEEVTVKCHPDAILAGTYFAEFPALVLRTSKLRGKIDDMLIKLEKPAITLEEAKAEAARLAAEEIEKAWVG